MQHLVFSCTSAELSGCEKREREKAKKKQLENGENTFFVTSHGSCKALHKTQRFGGSPRYADFH